MTTFPVCAPIVMVPMKAALAGMDTESAKAYATEQSAALAEQAHTLTLELYKHIVSHEHTYGEWTTTTAPTCKAEGVATQTCKFCDDSQTKSLPKSDEHSWDEGVVTTAATTEAAGVKTYTCTVCQATKTEAIPALEPTPDVPSDVPSADSNPATGDSTNLVLLVSAMILSVTGAAFVVKKKLLTK